MTTVVIAPHVDDEVLGCFSFLRPGTHVVYCGVEDRPTVPRAVRLKEVDRVASELGFEWDLLDNEVNAYRMTDLITPFEDLINRHRPEVVLVPQPSSYNQDHRAVFQACLVATRPHDTNWLVPRVLVFEQPHTILWPAGEAITPSLFVEIDVEAKIAAYRLYRSQVRGHRSPELVKALAQIRGAQIGRSHAEAFGQLRQIEPPR